MENHGGTEKNCLNSFVQQYLDNDDSEPFPISKYYDLDALITELLPHRSEFIYITLNIESIHAKIDKLKELIHMLDDRGITISAILLQETWLDENADLAPLLIPDYHKPTHQGRVCGRKGGLLTYVHTNYKKPIKRHNIYKQSKDWEALITEVNHDSFTRKITICNFYRPPRENYNNSSLDKFLTPFEPLIRHLVKSKSPLIIGGDSNINLLRLNSWSKCQEYFDILLGESIFPCITLPTRFSKRSATLIDHLFCRDYADMTTVKSGIILTKISDHLPCFSVLKIQKFKKQTPKFITISAVNKNSIDNFKQDVATQIDNTSFEKGLLSNPNINYDKLHDILLHCKHKNMPTKTVRFNKYKHKKCPWITYGIIESIKQRDKLNRKFHSSKFGTPKYECLEKKLRDFEAILQASKRKAKSMYYKDHFEKRKGNIKLTWKGINDLLGKSNKDSEFPSHLIHNGKIVKDDADIAESFNDFFINIGPALAKEIKTSSTCSYKTFLKEKINCNFNFKTVNSDIVKKVIGSLKSKASSGHDGISSSLIKEAKDQISNIITLIINQSISTGIFPDKLKVAKVIPVYKKDDNHVPGNYRPISLLPAISKIFEKVVYNQIYEYLNENKLLYTSQYGFRKKHSTELAAMEFIDRIFNHLDDKKTPLAIFIDLSKAFDTIDHSILLDKLKHYGIKGTALNWFSSYLSHRTQYVQYKDKSSSKSLITTGVPQGSILGPLLFIIYINDLRYVSDKFKCIIYADDTTLDEPICSFKNQADTSLKEIEDSINSELDKIVEWLALNKLSLNAKKTKMMLFHYKQRKVNSKIPKLKINGVTIERVKEFNFLGVTLDENMTWKPHTQKVANKIAQAIGTLKSLKRFLPRKILKTIYCSLILPHLSYGIILWGQKTKRIKKLQKWALRQIVNAKYNSHTEPILKRLKLLSVNDLYHLAALKLHHKHKNDELPAYFTDIFATQAPTHEYNTRHRQNRQQQSNTISASHSPRFVVPKLVETLPNPITSMVKQVKLQCFTRAIKKYLIGKYNETCPIYNCYICNQS